ncbi:MAG: glycosyltransferase [Prevotellaceae bacterium]|jgi:glycosyltransferase involved in cell wall biosynthesis|nr:glycosyltransferase [Prevotellaceae bacterium]
MISVCIATYNGEKYIRQQLSSILCQIGENDEVIVSDDFSQDKTLEILGNFDDKRIKIFQNELHNKTQIFDFERITANFENAIQHANGDLIFLSDQDDIWHENKVAVIKSKIGENFAVIHDCRVIDGADNELFPSYFDFVGAKKGILKNIVKCSYLGSCMAFKKELIEFSLPFPPKTPHDLWLALIAEHKKSLNLLKTPLIDYRRHENTNSTAARKSNKTFWYKASYRFFILFEFLKRVWVGKKI